MLFPTVHSLYSNQILPGTNDVSLGLGSDTNIRALCDLVGNETSSQADCKSEDANDGVRAGITEPGLFEGRLHATTRHLRSSAVTRE
jgi:hypothetical protein